MALTASGQKLWRLFQSEYVRAAVAEGVRPDGRAALACRPVAVGLVRGEREAVAEVSQGETRCLGLARCEVQPESEASVGVSLDVAAHLGEPEWLVEASRALHSVVSRSVDRDALAVVAGASAWSLSVHVHVLSVDGGVLDCAVLAALSSLRHLRRPANDGKEATPVPLVRVPLTVTVAAFDGRLVLDPSDLEEASADATVMVALDAHARVLGLSKLAGDAIKPDLLRTCADAAAHRATDLHRLLDAHLARADDDWRQAKVDRLILGGSGQLSSERRPQ